MKYLILLLGSIIPFSISQVNAQTQNQFQYNFELGSTVSSSKLPPFWLLSNQYGMLAPHQFNSWLRTGFKAKFREAKPVNFSLGMEGINSYSQRNNLYLQQVFAKVNIGFVRLQGGLIEEKFGNQDSVLSSGGLLWSGNARPMPKITFLVPKYTSIPFTKGYFEFKGGISHGWFGKSSFIDKAWLHHKYFYFQFGGKLPFHMHYGFHHFAQWGGVSRDSTFGKLPSSWDDYKKVFVADHGSNDAPSMESHNRLGNHLGTRNFGMDYAFKKWTIQLYWQNIFEDGSGLAYRNIRDGLWGISLKFTKENPLVKRLVLEYILTTDQSGEVDYTTINGVQYILGGNDNYFNHTIYAYGWSYRNMTIGTPLITSPAILKGEKRDYIRNNKIKAIHAGINGNFQTINYTILYTYSVNYGTNFYPFSKQLEQHATLLNIRVPDLLPYKFLLSLALGLDLGNLYGNSFGGEIRIGKSF